MPTEIEPYESFIRNLLEEIRSSHSGVFTMEDVLDDAEYGPVATPDDQDVMKRYASFNNFDTVMDHSDHLFSERSSLMNQASVCVCVCFLFFFFFIVVFTYL